MEDLAITERESEAIRRRLIVIRKYAAGDNQAEFARLLGINSTRWNNLERGFPLTLKLAYLLSKTVKGLTVSYVVEGNPSRMDSKLFNQLSSLEEELFPSKSKRSANK